MNGLPHASQSQIALMQKTAEEKYGATQEPVENVQPDVEVEPEVTPDPEQEPAPEAEVTEEETKEVQQKNTQESSLTKEENMRILRERYEKAERERDELIRTVQEIQSKASTPSEAKQIEQVKDDLDDLQFNPDDLAEGKHLLKLVSKIKRLEEKLEQNEKKSQMTTTELRIKRDFPDFDKVATYDNLKKLRDDNPDLADAILATPDVYKQHALAYKMVRQMGIYVEDNYSKDREIALKNSAKPRPLTSISPQQGESPLSKANAFASGLTDDLKRQLHKEMIESMKKI